jgi:hypothetical protein
MGLDLVVEGAAKPGHEKEWRRIMERAFADQDLSETEIAHFQEISVPGYAHIGAPRVGFDAAADAWIVEVQKAQTHEEIVATLKEFHGYHAVSLVKCDGVPLYSHGGLYDGVDDTSFRGAFLKGCVNVLDKQLMNAAWNHRFPDSAVAYGRELLAAADAAETSPRETHRSFLSRIGFGKATEPIPLSEQLDIVRAAGRWFVFWGERGHPIRAYV